MKINDINSAHYDNDLKVMEKNAFNSVNSFHATSFGDGTWSGNGCRTYSDNDEISFFFSFDGKEMSLYFEGEEFEQSDPLKAYLFEVEDGHVFTEDEVYSVACFAVL